MSTSSRRGPTGPWPIIIALALALAPGQPVALAGQSAGAGGGTGPPSSVRPLEVRVEGGVVHMSNFFQAPDGEPQRSVRAATGELQMVQPFGSDAEVFARALGTFYDGEFDPSGNFRAGARWSPGPHSLQGQAGYRWRMPRLDVGDSLGIANILHLGGNYSVRPARFIQLEALANYYDETQSRSDRANTFLDLGGALRYRGLDYVFSPEVGAAFGTRDVVTDTEDFGQRSLWITLRSMPTPALYLSLRYRNRLREYTIAEAAASNFGREDERHQITLTTALSLWDDWSWTVYYSFEHATSTNVSRNFDTHYLWTGLRYRLRGS